MAITIGHHDSALGHWLHATYRPPSLDGLVDFIGYFEGHALQSRERIFPDGRVELNIHLGPAYRDGSNDAATPFPDVCLSGLLTRTAVVEGPPGPTVVLCIRFMPGGAASVLGQPVHELTGITVDLGDVIAGAASDLHGRSAHATSAEARLRAAAAWLTERVVASYARGRALDPAIAWAAREIDRCHGALSIRRLIERTGWSNPRFTAAFREAVGVSPKRLARIARFRRALAHVNDGILPLATIALRTGYYDQAHFNAEFREFAGTSPSRYRAARRYPGSVNVVEPVQPLVPSTSHAWT